MTSSEWNTLPAISDDTLSRYSIRFDLDGLSADVLWFRAMYEKEPDWRIERHRHSSYEFHFVAGGGCRVILDNASFPARSGEFYVTGPNVFHEQQALDNQEYYEYSINYDLSLEGEADSEGARIYKLLNNSSCSPVPDGNGSISLFAQAYREAKAAGFGHYSMVKHLAAQILLTASRTLAGDFPGAIDLPQAYTKPNYRFEQIEKYVEDNLNKSIRVSDLRDHIFLSEKQICRIIQDQTGKSTKAYISSIRLQRAKSLLRESSLSIREISESLGFTSEYYFNQFFKREEGYPPGVYRQNVRKH